MLLFVIDLAGAAAGVGIAGQLPNSDGDTTMRTYSRCGTSLVRNQPPSSSTLCGATHKADYA